MPLVYGKPAGGGDCEAEYLDIGCVGKSSHVKRWESQHSETNLRQHGGEKNDAHSCGDVEAEVVIRWRIDMRDMSRADHSVGLSIDQL